MSSNLQDQLKELLDNKVITEDVALSISAYYKQNEDNSSSKLFLVFGIIGAILASLGIILVFAHNWDEMSRLSKCIVSFLPLLVGQLFCGYALFAKNDSPAWKESSASFLFFAVGATISLVAQTYNIAGDFAGFMFTWMLLCLPLLYLMKSNIVSLLYIVGITVYGINTNYFYYTKPHDYSYWLLLLGVLPHYYGLIKAEATNFRAIHNWFIPISIAICLGSISGKQSNSELLYFSYVFLFGCFYFIGMTRVYASEKILANGFSIAGKLGGLFMLYMGGFKFLWESLEKDYFDFVSTLTIATAGLFLLAIALLYHIRKLKTLALNEILQFSFLIIGLCYVISKGSVIVPVFICNIYLLLIGIREIQKGNEESSIARLNFGVLIIAILIFCRFFDTEMSFIVRGILFILVGVGFFGLNYYLLKNRKQDEK
ncbi:MAG: DUF2157 domain-containing protein [Flavobacterium sp.]|uniref:DUF2157 domain-containing protein n=1 Tax=Flavobacterium sp. TaxID=239 RepID=UPI003267560E